MKYGIITIHDTQNYGSLLQTYSTYKAVESLGYSVELIDYQNEAIHQRELPITEFPTKSCIDIIKKIMWGKAQKEKYMGVHNFLHENTKMSKTYDISTIKETNEDYQGFITGSDIVWGTKITGNDLTYFLDFADSSKRRISFSSSVGTKWTEEEEKEIKPLLQKYSHIAVREQLAADWIKGLLGTEINVTCDPTMLWDTSFWSQFVTKTNNEKYVLIYAVNPDKKNITDGIAYAKAHNMKAYFVNFFTPVKGTKTVKPVTVQEWISLFANASMVFSASYHGLLFSLYFQKPVFFYNRGEKSRMISLSKELGIENREGTDENIKNDIQMNYPEINKVIERKRTDSWNILKNELKIE